MEDAENRMKNAEKQARDRTLKLADAEAFAKEVDTERQVTCQSVMTLCCNNHHAVYARLK